ncbi:DNA double-strand break repair protein Mre11 [Haloglomus halophilum]|uniref:DNA double-strand break repair protein Mre11 n=1 Tax=Haloglomus halophilum TaxID=2962672 RepID=UPI0020C9FF0C|nr:DNA double-strand break repair protein Mre11 [Haloglomus halophilum]
MTRLLHTGDTHLGYRQYNEPARRQDFMAAFQQVVRDAIEADVDAVIHAGDLFHDRRPELVDLMGTIAVLRDLDEAGIPFLAVVGNHETKRDAQWLDLFASLGYAERLGDQPRVVGDVAVYGLDFVPRSQRDALEYEFADHDAAHAALVTHGLFQPFDHGDWDAREVLAEASVDFDAMLLGDNHKPGRERLEPDDGEEGGTDGGDGVDAWVTYCGSTERASADEREDRGYNLVSFDGTGADGVHITRRSLPTREFRFIDVELQDGEGVERVNEQVTQYDLDDAVAVVTITGAGERVAPAQVEERMNEQGALVARVNDRREFDRAGEEVEVSFADPDEAVRERVRELGLSSAARTLDETVRESKTPDSRVADDVEQRVRDLVDEGEASAFRPAPDVSETTAEQTGTAAEKLAGDGGDADANGESDSDANADANADTKTNANGEGEADSATATAEAETEESGTDGQGSLGDFA